MLSDGSNVFTWNARDQVATLNSVSLQYDGFGRRTKNFQNTSFLFDGANAVQELSSSTASANLITGGIDEIFTRADSTGTFTPLEDALGSTIALVDASGGLVTQYAYDPFGNTNVSGATNSNGFQYTGRENEGNGLYFYRGGITPHGLEDSSIKIHWDLQGADQTLRLRWKRSGRFQGSFWSSWPRNGCSRCRNGCNHGRSKRCCGDAGGGRCNGYGSRSRLWNRCRDRFGRRSG